MCFSCSETLHLSPCKSPAAPGSAWRCLAACRDTATSCGVLIARRALPAPYTALVYLRAPLRDTKAKSGTIPETPVICQPPPQKYPPPFSCPPPPLSFPGGWGGRHSGNTTVCDSSLCCCVGFCVVRHCHLYPLYSWRDIVLGFAEMERDSTAMFTPAANEMAKWIRDGRETVDDDALRTPPPLRKHCLVQAREPV